MWLLYGLQETLKIIWWLVRGVNQKVNSFLHFMLQMWGIFAPLASKMI